MGIQGLLPLLKPITKDVHLSQFSGQTIGVDTYCWLHKGVYGCATDIVEGRDTKVSRQENRAKGLAFLRAGNKAQATECFQKCVDITPEMAHEVIKVCRERNIDYVVAPYEADSQLAYLMKTGLTQATISEDSDLLVFGCKKVIFKMDESGHGSQVNLDDLPKLTDLRMHEFTMEKFRHMCILSGCDYLPSIKGIGLKTANKMIRKHSTIDKLIRSVRLENKLKVPCDYEKNFKQADESFLYQLVFDPDKQCIVPLTPLPDGLAPGQLEYAGRFISKEKAQGIALGNINPITHKVMDDYDPTKALQSKEDSIDKEICAFKFTDKDAKNISQHNTRGSSSVESHVETIKRFFLPTVKKPKSLESSDSSEDNNLMEMYSHSKAKTKSTGPKLKGTKSSGLSRKQRLKNPFRLQNEGRGSTGQTSSYFACTGSDREESSPVKNMEMSSQCLPELPSFLATKLQKHEEMEKENTPSPEMMTESCPSPTSSSTARIYTEMTSESPPTIECNTNKFVQHKELASRPGTILTAATQNTLNQCSSRSSEENSTKHKLFSPSEPTNTSQDSSSKCTKALSRFVYKPSVISRIDISDDNEVMETGDSGYLSSDGCDTSPAETKMENKNIIQLQPSTGTRRSGLTRCKSLGINKRKSKNKELSGTATLFNYFEYSKKKKARLEA